MDGFVDIFSNQQSAISNQQSAISNQQSAIGNQQSAISNQQSAIGNRQSAISNQQSAIGRDRASLLFRSKFDLLDNLYKLLGVSVTTGLNRNGKTATEKLIAGS